MAQPTVICDDERRRLTVRRLGRNGIDFVETISDPAAVRLRVHFFTLAPKGLRPDQVRIEGGRRIRDLRVRRAWIEPAHPDCLDLEIDRRGDFSTYTLRLVALVNGRPGDAPLDGLDPHYAQADFGFRGDCPSDLDCRPQSVCPPATHAPVEINYLAKDYASFRQLILDRLAVVMPEWRERHVPDIGITLVELLAYVGDHLSYYQDAVATEAYLGTARQRISIRRHVRLVDYVLHEGCNARTFIAVNASADLNDPSLTFNDLYFTTRRPDDDRPDAAEPSDLEVFEPIVERRDAPVRFYAAHSKMSFYTWGNERCCLPRGATRATLRDTWVPREQPAPEPEPPYGKPPYEQPPHEQKPYGEKPYAQKPGEPKPYEQKSHEQKSYEPKSYQPPPYGQPSTERPARALANLSVGDFLLLEEVLGPTTGVEADADPTHRHVVRLTEVRFVEDPLGEEAVGGYEGRVPIPLVEIAWSREDALPFPLCLSVLTRDCTILHDVSVARGNVLLVDHGRTLGPEDLGPVGSTRLTGACECDGVPGDVTTLPTRFEPVLSRGPMTFAEPVRPRASATSLLKQDPRKALPELLSLTGPPALSWSPQPDLLSSGPRDAHVVVEVDDEDKAHLRFGDGDAGRLPAAGTLFKARYRVGNGTAGNVAAETITRIAWRQRTLSGVTLAARNPLPARGGTAPEPIADARLFAPRAFLQRPQRAVTANDYARLAERDRADRIQRAGASLRWTGSWYAAQVAIDPLGAETAPQALLDEVKRGLHRYRRMGHDVEVRTAHYVPLDIALRVCILPQYLRGQIEAALLDIFSNRVRSDGQRGLFHPDALTFGTSIRASVLVAAAQAIPGVASVRLTRLRRFGEPDRGELDSGTLTLGPLEVPQLENDPSMPEHGTLSLTLEGGR